MVLFNFFIWWYSVGWARVPKEIRRKIRFILQYFSLTIILKTLFSPWKRDIAYASSKAIEDRFHALLGNLVSRFIGFLIRIIFMFIAVLGIVLIAILGGILYIIWPLLPLSPLLFIYLGVFG